MPRKTTPSHQLAEQIWIPNLNEKLVNQLSDERSNLSLYLESNFEWNKRIQPDYKPSFGSRLRLLYYFLIVQNDFNFLRTNFKIDSKHVKIPPSTSTLDRLTNKRLDDKVHFFLAYEHQTKFKGKGKNLVLTPWLETLRYKTVDLTETKYVLSKEELKHRIKQRGKLKKPKQETDNVTEIKRLKNIILEEKMKFDENYVSLEMLLQKDNPIKLAYIERRKKIFERYQDYANNCQRAFDNSYRKMQYKLSQESEFQEIQPSLKTEYGIKSYGQYISRIMNAAWQYYSEELKQHHNTIIPPQLTPLAGVHGRNRGWKNLVAAVVMVKGKWTDDTFLEFKRIYKHDPILNSIPSLKDAHKRFEQFKSNFGPAKEVLPVILGTNSDFQQHLGTEDKKRKSSSGIGKLLQKYKSFSIERKIRVKVESLRMSLKDNQQKKKFFPDVELKHAEKIILNDYLHRERRVPNQMD